MKKDENGHCLSQYCAEVDFDNIYSCYRRQFIFYVLPKSALKEKIWLL